MNTETNGLAELKAMIAGTIAAFTERKTRWKAMKAIQWRMRGPNGEYVGLDASKAYRCAFVPESQAMVFDGRDNEAHKLEFYQLFLGKLSVEIIPQIVTA